MPENSAVLDFLSTRKSVPLSHMGEPGPSGQQLARMLELAVRVPDHGRLTPWRFIVYPAHVGEDIGERLADLATRRDPDKPETELERDRKRLLRAPVAIGVVSRPQHHDTIPDWEQFLSAGAVAMNLVHAALASGFAANWVTGWFCDDAEGRAILGLAPRERMVGIVHIGSTDRDVPERPRPQVGEIISVYDGPYEL